MASTCKVKWGPGAWAFRCLTCQKDENACLCGGCVEGGVHQSHRVVRYRSVYGGSCDCGDRRYYPTENMWCDGRRRERAGKGRRGKGGVVSKGGRGRKNKGSGGVQQEKKRKTSSGADQHERRIEMQGRERWVLGRRGRRG